MQPFDYQKIVENAREVILLITPEGIIQFANPAIRDTLGYDPAELIGRPAVELVAPGSREEVERRLRERASGTLTPYRYTIKILHKNGEPRLFEVYTSAITQNGKTAWLQAIMRDITFDAGMRVQLETEKRKFEQVIENSHSIIIGVDAGMAVDIYNMGAREALGYERKEILGRKLWDLPFINERSRTIMASADPARMEAHEPVEGYINCKNGRRIRVSWGVSMIRNEDGELQSAIGIGHDVTARYQLEEVLRNKTRLLSIVKDIAYLTSTYSEPKELADKGLALMAESFRFTKGMAMQVDREGDFKVLAQFGNAPEPGKAGMELVRMAVEAQVPLFLPEDIVGTRHEPMWQEGGTAVIMPLKGRGGVIGVMYMCMDELLKDQEERDTLFAAADLFGFAFENAILRRNLEDSKGQVELYNDILLHDIMNYLVPIQSYLELISNPSMTEERRTSYLQKVLGIDERLNEFVGDVKVLLKSMESSRKDLVPISLVKSIRKSMEAAKGPYEKADLRLQMDPGEEAMNPLVLADEGLPEIFTNLLTNAIKFSDPQPITVRVLLNNGGKTVRVEVEDMGPGIPDDKKHRIFERRYSEPTLSGKRSTGLGLSIVRTLVENYGGKVWADDRVRGDYRQGAKFVVELNLA
jgi:PAS domain S-box-containing protein